MNDDIVLYADKLGKCFKIYSNPWYRALEWIHFGKHHYHQPFWALQDISFEARRGDFLGIIGLNGAGKSTLLKILTGILQPSTGTFQVNGRILSILELRMDFNPYLNGRENIIRNAELWGFPEGYVQTRIAQIAEFSELGEFFDRPVGLYSTGMLMRLAFSLFAFLECDVLILDEVLAVGDLFFRQKCYARLEELIANKTTIIVVTHRMDVIRQYCDYVIVLDKGRQIYQGSPIEALHKYHQIKGGGEVYLSKLTSQDETLDEKSFENQKMFWPADEAFTSGPPSENGQAHLIRFAFCNKQGKPCTVFTQSEQAYFYCEFYLKRNIGVPITGVKITNSFNVLVHGKTSSQLNIPVPREVKQGQCIRLSQSITLGLSPGEYVFGCGLATITSDSCCLRNDIEKNEIQQMEYLCIYDQVGRFTVVPNIDNGLQGTHLGLCDLTGTCQIQLVNGGGDEHHIYQ